MPAPENNHDQNLQLQFFSEPKIVVIQKGDILAACMSLTQVPGGFQAGVLLAKISNFFTEILNRFRCSFSGPVIENDDFKISG
jgi:hypothetical protein